MNREQIIRIAREAGLRVGTNLSGVVLVGSPAEIGLAHLTIEELERFAALVAAAEREACAKVRDGLGVHPALNVFNGGPEWYKHGKDCAAAIRARSK